MSQRKTNSVWSLYIWNLKKKKIGTHRPKNRWEVVRWGASFLREVEISSLTGESGRVAAESMHIWVEAPMSLWCLDLQELSPSYHHVHHDLKCKFSTVFSDPPLTKTGESTENFGGFLLTLFSLALPQKWYKFFFLVVDALVISSSAKGNIRNRVRLDGLINDNSKLIITSLFPRMLLVNTILTDAGINLSSLVVI